MIYTRKPSIVHAAQWNGTNVSELVDLFQLDRAITTHIISRALILVAAGGPAVLVNPGEWLTVDEKMFYRTYTDDKFRQEFEV